jgi:hypothetical protein
MLQRLGKPPEPKQTDAQRELSFDRESLVFFRSGYLQHFVCKLVGAPVIRSNEMEDEQATGNSERWLTGSVLLCQRSRPFQGIAHLRRRVT